MANFDIPGDDQVLRTALADVNHPTMLVVLAHLSGDNYWLSERFTPAPIVVPEGELFPDDSGNYTDEIAAEIRQGAFDLLSTLRDKDGPVPATSTAELCPSKTRHP